MIAIAGRTTALLVDFGARKHGLATVGYALLNPDGTVHTARTTSGIVNIAGGLYMAHVTLPAKWSGAISWDTGEAEPVYAAEDIDAANLEYLDAAVSSRATVVNLANTTLQVVGPVSTTGDITILAGDDYLAADSRALVFTDPTGTRWPSLAAATIELIAFDESHGEKFTTAGVEISATSPARSVSVDIEGDDTANVPGDWRYRLVAHLVSGSTVTLSNGVFNIESPFA
jgi:hypothetical protein